MGVIQTVLLVVIVIASVLLILLTLAQSNKGSDLGLFGGSTDMVFGSQKGNILTRTTAILATVVIAGSFMMGVLKVYVSRDKLELEKKAKKAEVKTLDDLKKKPEANANETQAAPKKAEDKKETKADNKAQ